jgi:hypothetical protein
LAAESKKQSFAKDLGRSEPLCTPLPIRAPSTLGGASLGKSLGRTQAIVQALQCVAFAYRPLHVDELLEALAMNDLFLSGFQGLKYDKRSIHSREDFTELLSEALEVKDNGLVVFKDSIFRDRIITENIVATGRKTWTSGHEILATICLQHLQCLGGETILKPWVSTNRWLVRKGQEGRLHSYAIAFWHEHCRLAEDQSRHLPALLHQTISSAIAVHNFEAEGHTQTLKSKTNFALWISAAYGLRTLCKAYLQMGGDLNFPNTWHKYPLQMLASPFRQPHLEPFLPFGRGSAMAGDQLLALAYCARIEGGISPMSSLIDLKRASNVCHEVGKDASGSSCYPGLSSLQMAVIYGHSAVLELFQEYHDLASLGLENSASHCAVKSGSPNIYHEKVQLKSRPFHLRHTKSVHAKCFSDVKKSLHSLPLADAEASANFIPFAGADATWPARRDYVLADCTPPEDEEWLVVTREDRDGGEAAAREGGRAGVQRQ